MSQSVEEIWNQPSAPPPAAAAAPDTTGEATESPAPADASTPATVPAAAPAELPESPSSGERDETTREAASAEDAIDKTDSDKSPELPDDPDAPIDTTKLKTSPAIRSYLERANKWQAQNKELAPLREAVDRLGGQAVLAETLTLREAFEAEDANGFSEALRQISPSKADKVIGDYLDAAANSEAWQDEVLALRAAKSGKSVEEVKAWLDGTAAAQANPAAAAAPDADADEYDAQGNYLTPEARRIRDLEAQLARREETDKQRTEREQAEAQTRQQAEQRAAAETATNEFIAKTWEPVEAKAKAAGLYPADGDSPELLEIKQEAIAALENELAKEFFEGNETKEFASRTLDYLSRGEREAAFKRLDAARTAAERLADKFIQRGARRIADHVAAQAHQLNAATAARSVDAVAAHGAPANFATPPAVPSSGPTNLDDVWAINPAATRDALARAQAGR